MSKPNFIERLQKKWQLKSIYQTVMVLIVFALTGSTVLFLKPFIFEWIGLDYLSMPVKILMYIVLVMPLYQILILIYGFLLGQFAFFLRWEKQFLKRMGSLFKGRKKD